MQFNKYTHTFVLQHALSFRTRHHLCRQGVSFTSPNGNNRTRAQKRDRGTAAGNFGLQQEVTSPRPEKCRNRGINTNGHDRWEDGNGVARGTVRDNERYDDSIEEVDGKK